MTVETTEDAAKNVHAFLTIFFETFDQFKGRKLHLAGESYAVRSPLFFLFLFFLLLYSSRALTLGELTRTGQIPTDLRE